MVNRKLMTVWVGVALATGIASWGQNAEAPKPEAAAAKPEAAAPAAKPEAAAPAAKPEAPKAQTAVPPPPPAPTLPVGAAPTRQRGVAAVDPERMKEMQKLYALKRENQLARRAVNAKQEALLNSPDKPEVGKQIKEIEEQIKKLQADIRTLEDSKPAVFGKADASLQAEYDKIAEADKQIQEMEKKLYPRPTPGMLPAAPKALAAPAPAPAPAPAAAPAAAPAPAVAPAPAPAAAPAAAPAPAKVDGK